LNYRQKVKHIFLQQKWDYALTDAYAAETGEALLQKWRHLSRGHSSLATE